MSVLIETTIGDFVFDLYIEERPRSCLNFLKLCKTKYYNFCLFHSIRRNFIAQSGDPTGTGRGGESVFTSLHGPQARYFDLEKNPRIKHNSKGTISFVNNGNNMHGSQFFITLGDGLDFLDGKHTVFGRMAEGFETLAKLNETICDEAHKPFQDVRVSHTIVLDDPFDDPKGLIIPDRSPEPTREQLDSGRIAADEDLDDDKTKEEALKELEDKELKIGTKILETVGDIGDAEEKPPENVLFVCKLNPVTNEDDLKIIFSRFGKISSCEIIKDQKTGDSLCYGFVEFKEVESCEKAYFKMDNVLIDDRRIHVDFCQSLAKIRKHHLQATSKFGKKDEKEKFLPKYKIKDQDKSDRYAMVFDGKEESKPKEKKSYDSRATRGDKIRQKRGYSSDSDLSDANKRVKKSHEKQTKKRRDSNSSSDSDDGRKEKKRKNFEEERKNINQRSSQKKERPSNNRRDNERLEKNTSRVNRESFNKKGHRRSSSPDSYDEFLKTREKTSRRDSVGDKHGDTRKTTRDKRAQEFESDEERFSKKFKKNIRIDVERGSEEEAKLKSSLKKRNNKDYSDVEKEENSNKKKKMASRKDDYRDYDRAEVKTKRRDTRDKRASSDESDYDSNDEIKNNKAKKDDGKKYADKKDLPTKQYSSSSAKKERDSSKRDRRSLSADVNDKKFKNLSFEDSDSRKKTTPSQSRRGDMENRRKSSVGRRDRNERKITTTKKKRGSSEDDELSGDDRSKKRVGRSEKKSTPLSSSTKKRKKSYSSSSDSEDCRKSSSKPKVTSSKVSSSKKRYDSSSDSSPPRDRKKRATKKYSSHSSSDEDRRQGNKKKKTPKTTTTRKTNRKYASSNSSGSESD